MRKNKIRLVIYAQSGLCIATTWVSTIFIMFMFGDGGNIMTNSLFDGLMGADK